MPPAFLATSQSTWEAFTKLDYRLSLLGRSSAYHWFHFWLVLGSSQGNILFRRLAPLEVRRRIHYRRRLHVPCGTSRQRMIDNIQRFRRVLLTIPNVFTVVRNHGFQRVCRFRDQQIAPSNPYPEAHDSCCSLWKFDPSREVRRWYPKSKVLETH